MIKYLALESAWGHLYERALDAMNILLNDREDIEHYGRKLLIDDNSNDNPSMVLDRADGLMKMLTVWCDNAPIEVSIPQPDGSVSYETYDRDEHPSADEFFFAESYEPEHTNPGNIGMTQITGSVNWRENLDAEEIKALFTPLTTVDHEGNTVL